MHPTQNNQETDLSKRLRRIEAELFHGRTPSEVTGVPGGDLEEWDEDDGRLSGPELETGAATADSVQATTWQHQDETGQVHPIPINRDLPAAFQLQGDGTPDGTSNSSWSELSTMNGMLYTADRPDSHRLEMMSVYSLRVSEAGTEGEVGIRLYGFPSGSEDASPSDTWALGVTETDWTFYHSDWVEIDPEDDVGSSDDVGIAAHSFRARVVDGTGEIQVRPRGTGILWRWVADS